MIEFFESKQNTMYKCYVLKHCIPEQGEKMIIS